jgi:UDP-2,3-diacylglucosamine pyrophosphatase LpxH
VLTVRGNHERWLLSNEMRILPHAHSLKRVAAATAAFLRALPAVLTVETSAGELLLCHGVGDDDMVRLGPDDEGYAVACIDELQRILAEPAIRFVVAGHTHRRMVRSFARRGDAPLAFINAGTLRHGDDPCCAILDVGHGVEFFDFPTPAHRSGGATSVTRKLWP